MNKFVVLTSQAKMPTACWGRYGNIAVVQVRDGYVKPKQIHPRHKAVERIVEYWGRRHMGKTSTCEYARCLRAANELCEKLNNYYINAPIGA